MRVRARNDATSVLVMAMMLGGPIQPGPAHAGPAAAWEAGPSFPDPSSGRAWAAGVCDGGTLYAIGGTPLGVAGDKDTLVHYLAPGGSTWQQGEWAEGRIVRAGAGVDGLGRIVVFGGVDGLDPEGDPGAVYVYDVVEGQMQGLADRSGPADFFAFATDDLGRLYAIGGGPGPLAGAGAPNSTDAERYDAVSDTWSPIAPLPLAIADATAVNDGRGHLLVLGGFDDTAAARLAEVLEYDVATDTWSMTTLPDLPVALTGLRAALGADGRVYAVGGMSGPVGAGTTVATTYVLDLDAGSWSVGPSLQTPRRNFAIARGDDDRIHAMGGMNDTGGTHLVETLYTPPCPVVIRAPDALQPWRGQTMQLSADVAGGTPLAFRWQRDGVDLNDGPAPGGGTISGATTTELTITAPDVADGGDYALVATNPCGSVTSTPASVVVRVPPAIPAAWTVTNLHPAGALSSSATDVTGDTQGGEIAVSDPTYGSLDHPVLWNGTAASMVDLVPAGSAGGAVSAAAGDAQVGWWWWPHQCYVSGQWQTCYSRQAAAWMGTADSHVNLQVSGWEYSAVGDTDGVVHGGTISDDDEVGNTFAHAGIWGPPTGSFTDLHPTGVSKSGINAVADGRQYGWINTPYPGPTSHAAMWSGTRESFVDLHPAWASRSWIVGAGDGQQVGVAYLADTPRAGVWAGSTPSLLDLTPPDASASLNDCRGGLQVGSMTSPAGGHATIWAGDPTSAFDLHASVPARFTSSVANGIDIDPGGTITVVGSGYDPVAGRSEALMWRSGRLAPEDVNGDGAVNVTDLLMLLGVWGICPGCPEDVSGDGVVDVTDLLAVLAAWS